MTFFKNSRDNNTYETLYNELKEFYTYENINKILPIIDSTHEDITMTDINHFAVNYSREHNIYIIKKNNVIFINDNYVSNRNVFKKKFFDPFCRKPKFLFKYKEKGVEKSIITSIGQLNFYRWAIKLDIIKLVEKYKKEIKEDIKKRIERKKKNIDSDSDIERDTTTESNSIVTVEKLTTSFDDD